MKARFVVLMGVAGSGKTTVGEALARRLGWDFYDADAFHPAENISKMANGIPLTDADRAPWLASLHALISASLKEDRPAHRVARARRVQGKGELSTDRAPLEPVCNFFGGCASKL